MNSIASNTQEARPRILAIDDIPANLLVLAAALSGEFNFQLAASGAAGLAMAEASPPDLILLDVMMPGMDGYETCRRLRANPALARVPVIFVTALTDHTSEVRGLEFGAADYLHKPVNIEIARQRIRNLVERDALRREVEQHRNRLEELVASRTLDLLAARDAAEVANRAKSAFLANMSHELRTPLGIMLGINSLLMQKVGDPGHKDKCNKIANAGKQLLAMIEDILQVSKTEAETTEAAQSGCYAFSPDTLLTLVEARFSAKAQAKGLELVKEVDPRLPKLLCGTPSRIKQILEHFVSNAIKFSATGRITQRVVLEHQHGDVRQLRFEVQDQGMGIAADDLDSLFKNFSVLDDSLTRPHGGIGIGLALSKHLAHTMGGSIGVDSRPGQGSRFWIRLKLSLNGATEPDPRLMPHSQTSEPAPPVPAPDVWAALTRLHSLLTTGDFRAFEAWEDTRALMSPFLGDRGHLFSEALEEYDFKRAQALLQDALGTHTTLKSQL